MSEDVEPHWSMLEFYRSIEKKCVYEAEDMVLERFGGADGGDEAFAVQDHAKSRGSAGFAPGPFLHWREQPGVREDGRVHQALWQADGLLG